MPHVLEELGLTENEIKLYQGYLESPKLTVAEVARKISMDKSSAYRAAENLEKLGLMISTPQTKGTTFIPTSPDNLNELIERRKLALDQQKDSLGEYIKTIKEKYSVGRMVNIKVSSGLKALQLAMTKSLNTKEKLIRERFRGGHRMFSEKQHLKFVLDYAHERSARGIKILQLEHTTIFDIHDIKEIMANQSEFLKEVRLLPSDFDDLNSIRIWDDVTDIVSYDDKGEFIVITIQDKFITEMMKNMYDFIWDRSKVITQEEIENASN
jgi:sugar-specific transcriptional regulator TrmB